MRKPITIVLAVMLGMGTLYATYKFALMSEWINMLGAASATGFLIMYAISKAGDSDV